MQDETFSLDHNLQLNEERIQLRGDGGVPADTDESFDQGQVNRLLLLRNLKKQQQLRL